VILPFNVDAVLLMDGICGACRVRRYMQKDHE